ncbi:MAG: hypothetical protein WD845_02855, partial [Pirellulales bacterium]
ARGEHDDGQVVQVGVGTDATGELHAVATWHVHVGDHDVGPVLLDRFPGLLAVVSDADVVSGTADSDLGGAEDMDFVVAQQDFVGDGSFRKLPGM